MDLVAIDFKFLLGSQFVLNKLYYMNVKEA